MVHAHFVRVPADAYASHTSRPCCHAARWAEGWKADEAGAVNNIPNVDKPKWLSNGKAMDNWCDRWSGNPASAVKNKISELQVAWFNGLGYESW